MNDEEICLDCGQRRPNRPRRAALTRIDATRCDVCAEVFRFRMLLLDAFLTRRGPQPR